MKNPVNVFQSYESEQEHTVKLPPILAKRAEIYAKENNTTITNIVIEALDSFLRENAKDRRIIL